MDLPFRLWDGCWDELQTLLGREMLLVMLILLVMVLELDDWQQYERGELKGARLGLQHGIVGRLPGWKDMVP